MSTQETYNHLTEAHGISRTLCKHCLNRDVEVYQLDFEGCYRCWCELTEPIIPYPKEFED